MRPMATVRYHSLDALRGTMMLLGIYLHAAVAYSRHGSWPWKDGSTTGVFDLTLGLIHVFRMPVFYCLAGFFAAFLLEHRGTAGFLKNRMVRILVPFAAGWAVLFPLVAALTTTAMNLEEPAVIPVKYLQFFSSGEVLRHLDPMHLWFLEYLLIFYAVAVVASPLARRLPAVVAGLERSFRVVVTSPLGPLVLAAVTFPALCFMQEGALDDPSGFVPEARILVTYLAFGGRPPPSFSGSPRHFWASISSGRARSRPGVGLRSRFWGAHGFSGCRCGSSSSASSASSSASSSGRCRGSAISRTPPTGSTSYTCRSSSSSRSRWPGQAGPRE